MQPPLDSQSLVARLSPQPSVAAQARGFLSRLGRAEQKAPPTVAELLEEGPHAAAAAPLTRAMPVALRYVGDRNQCLQEARSQCQLTHTHPECVTASAFLAGMLWHLLHGMPPREAMLASVAACGDLPPALDVCIRQASTHVRGTLDNRPWVQSAVENTLWALLTSCSYAETVTRVANLGGNATLSTALAGALAGAAYRFAGIPADWRRQVHGPGPVHGAPLWRDRELSELAERLVQAWGR
jgi:ADP-ribosylglycohydrolase